MTDTGSSLLAPILYLLPALVWGSITRNAWSYRPTRRARSRAFRLIPLVGSAFTAVFLLLAAWATLPGAVPSDPRFLVEAHAHLLREIGWLVGLALLRHLLFLVPIPERVPSRRWLAVNYGIALLAGATDTALRFAPGGDDARQRFAHHVADAGVLALAVAALAQVVRAARPGGWKPEGAGEIRRTDVLLVGGGLTLALGAIPLLWATAARGLSIVIYEVLLGLTLAAPFVFRTMGKVLPEVLTAGGVLAATSAVVAAHAAVEAALAPGLRLLVHGVTVLALALVVGPGGVWMRARADRLVLGRSRRRQHELLSFLQTLSPEDGVAECCRRALAELVSARHIPGAAIVLRDGEAFAHGTFALAPLRAVWPRGDAIDALPARPFGSEELRELPAVLRDALGQANVGLGTCPIVGPRGRWGHLFMNTGLRGGLFLDEDVAALTAFTGQLALVLDGAALLARAVAVERELAHAERLAAVGELAARIAHEIRNPVTAARSLAQLLAREPESPLNAEHARLVVSELDRVEQQVRALLRFARREEFTFAPVDLGELTRTTVEELRPRIDGSGAEVAVEAPDGLVARADREKLRQVLVNLVENACDALAARPGGRRLAVDLASANGTATLRVRDNGPGVPADALGRLFEPFFSLKAQGTGLGLAIAKRTVDAHGGRISAHPEAAGMTFAVELPLIAADQRPPGAAA